MSTRVKVEVTIEVQGLSVDQIRQVIHEVDEITSGGQGIAPENVQPFDVIGMLYVGATYLDFEVVADSFTEIRK